SGGETEHTAEGVKAAEAGNRAFETGTTLTVTEQVEFVDYEPIDFWDPGPVGAPGARAGIQALGCHDHDPRVGVGDWKGFAGLAVVAGKNANRGVWEDGGPRGGKLIGQGTEWAEIHGAESAFQ
ncbi:MAG: hypothetical protein WCI46_10325, partial [Verrucomicrobiota bacterium]